MNYSSTVLNGVVDWIISALFSVVNWLFHSVLTWVLKFVYEAVIYVPLVCINAIVIIFRFFCGGFANYIFGDGHQLFDPSTGRIDLSGWSLTSPLGIMVYFSFIVSVILFFIFFLLTFRGGAKNDAGKPIEGAWMRFAALKWPLFMIASLYIMPYLFVLADYFMQQLMLFFNNSLARSFTQDDINNLTGNFETDFHNFASNIGTATVSGIGVSGLEFQGVLSDLQTKCQILIDWNTDTGKAAYFGEALANLQTDLNSVFAYVNSGGGQISGAMADSAAMDSLISTFQVGSYISTDNLLAIEGIRNNMNSFYNLMSNNFGNDSTALNSDVFDNVWKSAGYAIALGGAGITKDQVLNPLNAIVDTWKNGGTGSICDFKNLANMLSNGVNGQGQYDPTRYICLSDLRNHVEGISNFQMVGLIYSLATGDPNPNNWSDPYGNDFAKRADVMRWVTTTFAVWGMILIVYTYASEAMKRTYYLVGYWIIGFLYLANGISQTNAAIKWYKQIFFRWFGVILIMICFEMAGVLVTAIIPTIQATLNLPIYNFGGSEVLVILGVIMAMEGGFQVGYMIYQKFMGEAGSGAENFKYQSPNLMSSGNDLFNSALASAEYYGTGGPVKDAYNKVSDYKEYWLKKGDTKLKREGAEWSVAERMRDQQSKKEGLNAAGYDVDFDGPSGLSEPTYSGKPYGGSPGSPAVPGGAGGAPVPAVPPRPDNKVRVPANFTNARRSNDPLLDQSVDHWYQGDTLGKRVGNIGRNALTGLARGGEALHNAGAWLTRKTGIAGLAMGVAGFFGGANAVAHVERALGDSNNRITRAEKEWAKANNVAITKSRTTGAVEIVPQGAPAGPGPDTSLTGRMGSSQLHNDKLWYNDDNPQPAAPRRAPRGRLYAPPAPPAPLALPAPPVGGGGGPSYALNIGAIPLAPTPIANAGFVNSGFNAGAYVTPSGALIPQSVVRTMGTGVPPPAPGSAYSSASDDNYSDFDDAPDEDF